MTKGQFCLHYPLVTLMSTWGEWYKRCPNYLCTSSSSPTDCNSNAYTQTHITTQIVAVKKPKRTDTDNMWDNKHWWKGVNTPRTQALDPINHYIQLVSTHIRIGTARWWEDWNCYDWDIRSASKISSWWNHNKILHLWLVWSSAYGDNYVCVCLCMHVCVRVYVCAVYVHSKNGSMYIIPRVCSL